MKAVQDNAVKNNPEKKFIAIVLVVVLGMIVGLVVEPLRQITHRGHIIIINHRHVRGVVALAGLLVVIEQIAVRVDLVSVVAN